MGKETTQPEQGGCSAALASAKIGMLDPNLVHFVISELARRSFMEGHAHTLNIYA